MNLDEGQYLQECEHRCWCEFCKKPVIEGTKFFRYDFSAYLRGKRLNICYKCLIEIGEIVKKDKKTFEKLEKMTPKERKEKLKLTKFLGDKND